MARLFCWFEGFVNQGGCIQTACSGEKGFCMPRSFFSALLAVFVIIASGAQALEPPKFKVLLRVSGDILTTNVGDMAEFDLHMLHALDWQEIETFTAFTQGPQRFAGPTLASILEAVGARGRTIRAYAINDYSVEIPIADAVTHDVLVAVEHNGQRMRIRDHGPLWIIYPEPVQPLNEGPKATKMVWQLSRLVVER